MIKFEKMTIFEKCKYIQSELEKINKNLYELTAKNQELCILTMNITEKLSDRAFCKAIKCPNQTYLDSQPLVKVEIEDTLRNCRKYCRHTAYEVNEWLKGSESK